MSHHHVIDETTNLSSADFSELLDALRNASWNQRPPRATRPPRRPACCSGNCQRPAEWRHVGGGRRPFCDTCWQSYLRFVRPRESVE